jgi:hypothetical protein
VSQHQKIVITLSVLIALLIIGISLVGIFSPNFYAREAPNWQVQSVGQDYIDLVLIVPALLMTAMITRKSISKGILLWAGVLLYLVYTFTIYAFDVHFNQLFILYCLTLGLSFYSLLFSFYVKSRENRFIRSSHARVRKVIGIYFLTIASLFYMLWLSEVIPASLNQTTPKVLLEVELPTNPIHVIDLAIILPGIFITGLLLLKDNQLGHTLTPVFLIFFLLMDITIGTLSLMMKANGFEGSYLLILTMVMLAILSVALLSWYMRSLNVEGTNPPPMK